MSFVTYVMCKSRAKVRLSFEICKKALAFFCISKTEYLLSVASLDESVASAERDTVRGTIKF